MVFVKRRVTMSRTENLCGMRWIDYYTSWAYVKSLSALAMSVCLRWYERGEEKRDGAKNYCHSYTVNFVLRYNHESTNRRKLLK